MANLLCRVARGDVVRFDSFPGHDNFDSGTFFDTSYIEYELPILEN